MYNIFKAIQGDEDALIASMSRSTLPLQCLPNHIPVLWSITAGVYAYGCERHVICITNK